jgi:hypothetical protein
VRLTPDPLDESADVGLGPESFERVVLALQLLVVQDGMYVPVAGGTEIDGTMDLSPVEGLFVPFVFVARPWDEVVPG